MKDNIKPMVDSKYEDISTPEKAVGAAIDMWTWIVETGGSKHTWMRKFIGHESWAHYCPLCETFKRGEDCSACPYMKHFHFTCFAHDPNINHKFYFSQFCGAEQREDEVAKKEYASLFLAELCQVKAHLHDKPEPKWVDVTSQCVVNSTIWYGRMWLKLYHKEYRVADSRANICSFGELRTKIWNGVLEGYRIEENNTSFKVEKLGGE